MISHPTRFDERKATQTAGILIKREGGTVNHMKLIKLLYLADRLALLKHGSPITFDWYYSMDHGPVLSYTLNLINRDTAGAFWPTHISERQNHQVSLTEDPGIEWLSEPEINLIEGVYDSYGALDQWGLRDLTHNLPEWSNPRGSRLSINHKDILLAEEFSEDEAEEIVEEISHHSRLKSVAR